MHTDSPIVHQWNKSYQDQRILHYAPMNGCITNQWFIDEAMFINKINSYQGINTVTRKHTITRSQWVNEKHQFVDVH